MFLFRSSCFLDWVLVLSLDLPHWIRVEGRLIRFLLEMLDMDQRVVVVDQFTTAMTSIQEASASPRQKIDSQQSRQFIVQDETPCDSLPHLPPPLFSSFGMILRVIRGLIRGPRGKFRPNLEQTLFHQEVDPRGRCMVDGSRWKPILRAN
ncbi:hypothetical protein CK203_117341 [Vitis vinifera]|uniref:Uncharacterized protein n=1 Tax=Vitis vinifera TaxID=29760 RepID=A0A438CQ18_VITVI|nr:hypothetical protein CK203_117341 [Vitis vinifera]